MANQETSEENDTRWKRRTVLKVASAGAALPFAGAASANGHGPPSGRGPPSGHGQKNGQAQNDRSGSGNPHCADCPEGTTLLAKYEVSGGEFVFEKGACEDAIHNIKTTEESDDGEPLAVEFDSDVFIDSARVKYGPTCDNVDNVLNKPDPKKDTYSGEIDVSDQKRAISHISFCAGVCYQVDLVVGDERIPPGADKRENGRLVAYLWGSTQSTVNEDESNRTGEGSTDSCTINNVGNPITVTEDGKASVTFSGTGSCNVILTSYVAPCPPYYRNETADQQVVHESTETTYSESDGNVTLAVDLPGLSNIGELC